MDYEKLYLKVLEQFFFVYMFVGIGIDRQLDVWGVKKVKKCVKINIFVFNLVYLCIIFENGCGLV